MKNDILESAKTALIDSNYKSNLNFKPTLLVNNNNNKLLSKIIDELENCESFKFSTAFITLSGVQPLKEIFNYLEEKKVPGKILTTDYLYFTEPKAIKFLNSFANIEIKIFKDDKHGFHTKGYLFEKNNIYTGIIGSSNLTSNALNQNQEWNIGFTSTYDGELLENLNNEFNKLWDKSYSFDEYFNEYKHIYNKSRTFKTIKSITKKEKDKYSKENKNFEDFQPNTMQKEFLKKMDSLIERGETKAMFVSATGTGKTCASAFEVRKRLPKKFLFLVHRFQILDQAKKTYEKVINDFSLKFGFLGDGHYDLDADYLFSTFQSLNSNDRYKEFNKDYFDYIVVDEVHKAGADTYKKIISYFNPQFLLGMTATPWRNDDEDIFEIFDNNIVHEVTLQDALNDNLVCPFHYYGISDLDVIGKDNSKVENFRYLISEERAKKIINKSKEYGFSGDKIKSLVFCSSIDEAKELAKIFTRRGHNSKSLDGEDDIKYREKMVDCLKKGKLEYIFTYDVFNEGVDIPEVNQVIFIRKTKSPIVFTQQLGRGMRTCDGKDFVVVLDFIGNYNENYMIPIALSGLKKYTKDDLREYVFPKTKIIEGSSSVSFDKIARLKILRAIDSSNFSTIPRFKEEYFRFKRKIGRIPMLCDIQESGDFNPNLIFEHKDFSNYYKFLNKMHQNDTEFNDCLDEKYHYSLNFISLELSKGIRPHELIILNLLKNNKYFTIKQVEKILNEDYGLKNQLKNIKSAINVLNFDFYRTKDDIFIQSILNKYIYDKNNVRNTFFKMNDYIVNNLKNNKNYKFLISENFKNLLSNSIYHKYFEDTINFSLRNYENSYKSDYILKLYAKYSRKDFFRLFDWNYNDVVYGYFEKNSIIPIFVNYEKDEDISENLMYEDKFVSNDIFKWESRDIGSKDGSEKELIEKFINYKNNDIEFFLFIRKSENEKDGNYYYMGKVEPITYIAPQEKPYIYKFDLKLETPVENNLYEYITTPLYHNLD